MAKDDKAVAIGAVEEFFSQLEVEGKTTVEVEGDIVSVLLDTKESGIVIGYHGEILESLEVILSLIISRKLGRFIRVSVEVGDYKKNRSAYLENLALQMKEQALQDKREYTLHDFFSVWGEPLEKPGLTLTMTVDGKPNTELGKLLLKDKQEISLSYVK